jgi:sigma-B regulation protein RsbU (phosphoserine phosphatase)
VPRRRCEVRGYRRRTTASYLVGVAASFFLVMQLASTLLQLSEKSWWGILVRGDGRILRVFEGSPAEGAGILKGEKIRSFAGAPWARPWERRYLSGGSVLADVESAEGAVRSAWLERAHYPRAEIARQLVFGFVVLSFLLIGLVVFLSRSDRVATLFFLMCLLFSRIIFPPTELLSPGAYFFDKVVLDVANLLLPAVLLHFFLSFPQRARTLSKYPWIAWLLYLPAAAALPFAFKFDADVVLRGHPVSEAALRFQTISALVFVAMIVLGIVSFLRAVRAISSPLLKKSLKFVLPGTALGILPPLLVAVILNVAPWIEIPGDRYVVLSFVLVPLSFAHAIFRYGLMDLELVVKRSAVYTTLTALLVALYYLVAEVLGTWILSRTGTGRTVLSFVVVFASALLFIPARDKIQSFVDRTFYRSRYSYRKTLREFASLFSRFFERSDLVGLLIERLPQVLGVERAVLFARSKSDQSLHLVGTRGIGQNEIPLPYFRPSAALLAWWREFQGPVAIDPASVEERLTRLAPEEASFLRGIGASVLVFLPRERKIEGLLILGAKSSGEPYQGEDLELLATLGDQAGTALSSARLHEDALERRRLEEELSVARRIQATLLPSEAPRPKGVEIAALTRPCQQVGGDFYDFLDLGPYGLGLAVADVSGKGVPAALILSGLQATLRAAATPGAAPEPIVRKINERLCTGPSTGSFASLVYGQLDVASRAFRYVNAGHPAGIVVRRDGTVSRLAEGGMLLGIEPKAEYRAGCETFAPGDLLLLYSDGVTDVLNSRDEEFGTERLETLLPRVAHLSGSSLLEAVVAAVESFVGGALPDDITLLVAKFLPDTPAQEPAV